MHQSVSEDISRLALSLIAIEYCTWFIENWLVRLGIVKVYVERLSIELQQSPHYQRHGNPAQRSRKKQINRISS